MTVVRKSAGWMGIFDECILAILKEDGPSSTSVLAATKGIRGSEDGIYIRCKILEDADLITQSGQELFEITPRGRQYLNGEVDLGDDDSSLPEIVKIEIGVRPTGLEVPANCLWSHCPSRRSLPA